jgi:hypothetical protein
MKKSLLQSIGELIPNPDKGSVLNRYAKEVVTMRENKVPYVDISIWLKNEYGILVSHQNVRDWHNRLSQKHDALFDI